MPVTAAITVGLMIIGYAAGYLAMTFFEIIMQNALLLFRIKQKLKRSEFSGK